MNSFFKKASDLPSGDLTGEVNNRRKNDIRTYVENHVSHRSRREEMPLNAGRIIVTFEQFCKMVAEGYNIVEAEIIGDVNGKFLISITFEGNFIAQVNGKGGR